MLGRGPLLDRRGKNGGEWKGNGAAAAGGYQMIVVSYADFFANPALYKEAASVSGIKVLPEKKKLSRRVQKKLEHLKAVVGIFPQDADLDAMLEERRTTK